LTQEQSDRLHPLFNELSQKLNAYLNSLTQKPKGKQSRVNSKQSTTNSQKSTVNSTLPPLGEIFEESIISSLDHLGRYSRRFCPPPRIQNIKNMQKNNPTDNNFKIVTFMPSQPCGAEPQKAEAKSKGNVT